MIAVMEKLRAGARKLGIELTDKQIGCFEVYYRELVDWNQKVNLTSVTDYEGAQLTHFLDSLSVVKAVPELKRGGIRVLDVGTGAGLPGVPLKLVLPGIRLVLLEATAKRTKFLKSLVTRLGLEGVEIITGRAEDAAHDSRYRGSFDLVLSRAVASMPTLVELTLPFCAVGGSFIAQKKGVVKSEIASAARAISEMGGKLREVMPVDLEELDGERCLVVIDKVGPTPDKYPRRSGMPAKRPIIS